MYVIYAGGGTGFGGEAGRYATYIMTSQMEHDTV